MTRGKAQVSFYRPDNNKPFEYTAQGKLASVPPNSRIDRVTNTAVSEFNQQEKIPLLLSFVDKEGRKGGPHYIEPDYTVLDPFQGLLTEGTWTARAQINNASLLGQYSVHIDLFWTTEPVGIFTPGPGTGVQIEGGYRKITGKQSKKVISVPAGSVNVATRVCIATDSGGPNQRWKFEKLPDAPGVHGEWYKIVGEQSDLVIDVKDWWKEDQGIIHLWGYQKGDNQKWGLVRQPDGYVRIVGKESNRVIDVTDYGTHEWAPLQTYRDLEGSNQQWLIE